MSRPTLRAAVEWIAFNDDAGADDALDVDAVAGFISTMLVADLFGKEPEAVARLVVAARARNGGGHEAP